MAPLQKRALISLVLGVIWAAAAAIVFVTGGGVEEFTESKTFRLVMDAIFIGWLVVYLVLTASLRRFSKSGGGAVTMDERDIAILHRAPVVQLWAVIVSLVIWAIALTEAYWDRGAVPVMYLYIIFFSSLVVSTLAQSAGILIGYRMN